MNTRLHKNVIARSLSPSPLLPSLPLARFRSVAAFPSIQMADDMVVDRSTEEDDLLARSRDKPKDSSLTSLEALNSQNVLQSKSGVEALTGRISDTSIYIGDGEEDNDMVDFEEAIANLYGDEVEEDAINLELDECLDLWRPWRRAIIIKLLGRKISFNYLVQKLSNVWRHEGRIEITDLDNDFYVVRFTRKTDYERLMWDCPWMILGNYLWVQKWKPFFQPSKEKIKSTLAWIRFREFPNELFRESLIKRLGTLVGRVVKVVTVTLSNSRAKIARCCVEVNLTKGLRSSVVMNGRRYQVEYEGLQSICFDCGKFGHKLDECPDKIKETNPEEASGPKATVLNGPTVERPYGPWMIADTRRRRPIAGLRQNSRNSNNIIARHTPAKNGMGVNGSRFGALVDEEKAVDGIQMEDAPTNNNEADILRYEISKVQPQGGPVKQIDININSPLIMKQVEQNIKKKNTNANSKEVGILSDLVNQVTPKGGRVGEMQSVVDSGKRKEQATGNGSGMANKKRFPVQKGGIIIQNPLHDVSNAKEDQHGLANTPIQPIQILRRANGPDNQLIQGHTKYHPPDEMRSEGQLSMDIDGTKGDSSSVVHEAKDHSRS